MISALRSLFVKKKTLPEVRNKYQGIILKDARGVVHYRDVYYFIETLTCDIMHDNAVIADLPLTDSRIMDNLLVAVRNSNIVISNTQLTAAIRGHDFVTNEYTAVIGREKMLPFFKWVFASDTKYNAELAKSELVNYLSLINKLTATVEKGDKTAPLTETCKANRIEALKTLQFNLNTLDSILKILKEKQ